jgi:aryl-alcohol dehydrogenase-like predicted oxidoreductase
VDALQPPYNLLHREIESELLPFCREQGIGIVTYSPLASGLLSGRFDPAHLAADDWRRRGEDFTEPLLSRHLAQIAVWQQIARRQGRPLAHLAIAWVLRQSAVTSAIVGARTVAQVEEMAGAAEGAWPAWPE